MSNLSITVNELIAISRDTSKPHSYRINCLLLAVDISLNTHKLPTISKK